MTPSEERMLHPSSLIFSLGMGAGRFLWPALLFLFATGGGAWWNNWGALLIIPIVASAATSILRYLTYRYQFAPGELVIRSGFIFHNERHIPYERIHNIGTVRNVLHRMLGVADVRLETAGGQEPEASIQVLGMEAVEEIRRRVFEGKRVAAPPHEEEIPDTTLVKMSAWDVALFGLVDNRGGIVVGTAIGLLWEMSWQFGGIEQFTSGPTEIIRAFFSRSIERIPSGGVVFTALFGIVGFMVLLRVFSMGWAFINLHGFHLSLSGSDLNAVSGLFTRVATSIPLHRIQVVVVRETPLHRLLGCVEVKVETAGGGAPGEGKRTGREWLAPLLPKEKLASLLAVVQPGVVLNPLDWRPVDPLARVRILKRGIIVAALLLVPFIYFIRWWAIPGFLALAVIAFLESRHQPPHMSYAATPSFIAWRSGWLWRKIAVARVGKIQAVTVAQSPFDRRYAMASVKVDTAGAASSAQRIAIPYLDAVAARDLASEVAARAQSSEFRW